MSFVNRLKPGALYCTAVSSWEQSHAPPKTGIHWHNYKLDILCIYIYIIIIIIIIIIAMNVDITSNKTGIKRRVCTVDMCIHIHTL